MTKRLIISYLAVTVVVLVMLEIPLAVFFAQRERERLSADMESDARVIATIYEDALEKGTSPDPGPAFRYTDRTGARVVVVNTTGLSQVDTEQSIGRDLSTRPEIAQALAGKRAAGTRFSDTLHADLWYVAVPIASGGVVHGALRISFGPGEVDGRIHRFWLALVLIAVVVLLVMGLVGWAIARSVTRPLRRLNETATRFGSGDLTVDEHPAGGPPEIRALDERMSNMAVRLAALVDEQRAFVADASHQLRTPLTALRLRLEILQGAPHLAEADVAELEAAIEETDRLARLVGDLLQLARAEQHPTTAEADLARLTADRVDTWSAAADQADVRLVLGGADRPALVWAVPGAIEQILDNVIDNAILVSRPGSTIEVTVTRGSDSHRLSIADHGPGLSDEDKARATRRFWRGSTATPGTGLGLAIAQALAVASGGSLSLSDTPGGGLTIVLTLPVASSVPH